MDINEKGCEKMIAHFFTASLFIGILNMIIYRVVEIICNMHYKGIKSMKGELLCSYLEIFRCQ